MNRHTVIILTFLVLLTLKISAVHVSPSNGDVIVLEVTGTITAATAQLVEEAVKTRDIEAEAIIILLDTPGGELDATMRIVESIERSSIPVVSFVYPRGAKAWSAGTMILIASHIAAMAPHTVIGSAQPVSYSPFEGSKPVEDEKVLNALSMFMTEKARMHGRNETAARLFVEENLNLNSEEAYRLNVVEVIASDLNELITEVDGFTVSTINGSITLHTEESVILEHTPSFRVRILSAISNPLLAYMLFIVGLYALVFGFSTPGYGGEVIGAIALITGLIGLGFDINLGAMLLVGLGALLMIAEAYTPGFGILGGAGLFCLTVGGLLIMPFTDSRWMITPEWYRYFMTIALGVVAVLGGFTLFMVYKVLKARMRKPVIGELIGTEVEVADEISPGKPGFVRYKGEYWKARAKERIRGGDKALVVNKDGPILIVKPIKKEE